MQIKVKYQNAKQIEDFRLLFHDLANQITSAGLRCEILNELPINNLETKNKIVGLTKNVRAMRKLIKDFRKEYGK